MTTEKARKLLESIPEDQFMTGAFTDRIGKCCGIGHLIRLSSTDPSNYGKCFFRDYTPPEGELSMIRFMSDYEKRSGVPNLMVINDSKVGRFRQETPKQRLMAALDTSFRSRVKNFLYKTFPI